MSLEIAKKQAIEDRMIQIQLADDAMGSFGGSINRQRQEGLPETSSTGPCGSLTT